MIVLLINIYFLMIMTFQQKIQHNLVQIEGSHVPKFKEEFKKRYSKLTDWNLFEKYNLSYLNRALRVNTLRISPEDLKKRLEAQGWVLEQIPWNVNGFWAKHKEGRLDLGNTLEHQLGYFYIQGAASMLPPIVLSPEKGDLVWDMCASPGSKTTQIAEMMENEGIIIANDVTGMRLAPLGVNIQRLGVKCCVQLQADSSRINFPFKFDKILLDAPCSGVGTIRKSLKTINMWNPKTLKKITSVQKRLLENAWIHLKEQGILVYSTCSTEPEEDEEIVSDFISSHPDSEVVEIRIEGFKHSSAITSFNGKNYSEEVKKTLRVWPQDNDTQGFYVAKIRKK